MPGDAKNIVLLKCPELLAMTTTNTGRERTLCYGGALWSLERVNMNMKLNQRISFLIHTHSLSITLSPPPQSSAYNKRKQHSSSRAGLSLALHTSHLGVGALRLPLLDFCERTSGFDNR